MYVNKLIVISLIATAYGNISKYGNILYTNTNAFIIFASPMYNPRYRTAPQNNPLNAIAVLQYALKFSLSGAMEFAI